MRCKELAILAIVFASSVGSFAQSEDNSLKRYLYLGIPDAAQKGDYGAGILIFDIDNGHRFVRRIDIPEFKNKAEGFKRNGLRGLEASLANKSAYFAQNEGVVGRFDLEKDEVIWIRKHEFGADRASVTLDGKALIIPTGWWHREDDGGMLIANAANGEIIDRIEIGSSAHNSVVSADGEYLYIGGWSWFGMFRTKDYSRVHLIKSDTHNIVDDIGDNGVFPFTVNSDNTRAYVCHHDHLGFDILDLVEGKKIHTISVGSPPIERRTHGIALTPDEKEVWISDQKGKRLIIFDNTVTPPKQKTTIKLSKKGHGWISFSRNGKYAWTHTPEIFDANSKKVTAVLRDQNGDRVASSKFFEVHFRDKELVWAGSQFGLGLANVAEPVDR